MGVEVHFPDDASIAHGVRKLKGHERIGTQSSFELQCVSKQPVDLERPRRRAPAGTGHDGRRLGRRPHRRWVRCGHADEARLDALRGGCSRGSGLDRTSGNEARVQGFGLRSHGSSMWTRSASSLPRARSAVRPNRNRVPLARHSTTSSSLRIDHTSCHSSGVSKFRRASD